MFCSAAGNPVFLRIDLKSASLLTSATDLPSLVRGAYRRPSCNKRCRGLLERPDWETAKHPKDTLAEQIASHRPRSTLANPDRFERKRFDFGQSYCSQKSPVGRLFQPDYTVNIAESATRNRFLGEWGDCEVAEMMANAAQPWRSQTGRSPRSFRNSDAGLDPVTMR